MGGERGCLILIKGLNCFLYNFGFPLERHLCVKRPRLVLAREKDVMGKNGMFKVVRPSVSEACVVVAAGESRARCPHRGRQ